MKNLIGAGSVEDVLLSLHTAFLGRIVSVDTAKGTATVQPLTLAKPVGGRPVRQPVLKDLPMLANARYRIREAGGSCGAQGGLRIRHAELEPVAAGDIVLCAACERDISEARRGRSAVPAIGHHQMKDSVVLGVLA